MLVRLPSLEDDLGNVQRWVAERSRFITVETLFNSKPARTDVLLVLLARVREHTRSLKPVHKNERRHRTESKVRAEVYDWPAQFCFDHSALREYHAFHLAAIIGILLLLLEQQGIDARHKNPGPKPPPPVGYKLR